jgi:hypothetical protein
VTLLVLIVLFRCDFMLLNLVLMINSFSIGMWS